MKILFVCLGNICRSPSAHAMLRSRSLGSQVFIDSAGTGNWHAGEPPYAPMQRAAKARGITMSDLRARVVTAQDYERFDVMIAMDHSNFAALKQKQPVNAHAQLFLMGQFATGPFNGQDVPDPYYTRDFDATLDMLENALDGLELWLRDQGRI